jgi:hypothetical protein
MPNARHHRAETNVPVAQRTAHFMCAALAAKTVWAIEVGLRPMIWGFHPVGIVVCLESLGAGRRNADLGSLDGGWAPVQHADRQQAHHAGVRPANSGESPTTPTTGGLGNRAAPRGVVENPLRPPSHTTHRRSAHPSHSPYYSRKRTTMTTEEDGPLADIRKEKVLRTIIVREARANDQTRNDHQHRQR